MVYKEYFRNVKETIRIMSVRRQIFFSMLIIIVLLNIVLGNFIYKRCVNAIESNYENTYISSLVDKNKIFDMLLSNIVNISRSILVNKEVCDAMEYGNYYGKLDASDKNYKIMKDFVNELSNQDALISSVAIMDLSGNIYFSNNIGYGTYGFYNYWKTHNYKNEFWIDDTKKAKGLEVFYGEAILPGMTKKNNQISLAKYLINPNTNRPMGFMVIQVSKQILKKSFDINNGLYASEQIFVLDSDNKLVYFTGDEENVSYYLYDYLKKDNSKYLFCESENEDTGWRIVHAISKNELSKDSQYIKMLIIETSILLIFFSVFIANTISNRITNPLYKLKKTIESVGDGNRDIQENFDDSEVGVIGNTFKDMVKNNIELSEKLLISKINERDAELLLLQAQINPHFLYNTLDSLYFMAIIEDNEKIANMILALSDNFKLNLNNGEKFCNITNIILKTQQYMKIQNMRFNDRFELKINVEERIVEKRILNFVIQPFVENAIYHGLEPKTGKGEIIVNGYSEDNKIVFEIIDNGVGIPKADMSSIYNGYAIKNIIERISLTHNNDVEYGIKIISKEFEGTKVIITLPLYMDEEK